MPAVVVHPLRIYLDQKEFIAIANALGRGDMSCPEALAYERLQRLVSAGKARVYFSYVHVVEALRHGNVRSPLVAAYCAAVDTLTDGHCIRHASYLQSVELELALADLFGFSSAYSKETYAYGKHADGLTGDGVQFNFDTIGLSVDSALQAIEQIRAEWKPRLVNRLAVRTFLSNLPPAASRNAGGLLPRGMTGKAFYKILLTGSESDRRLLANSVFGNPDYIRRMVDAASQETFDDLNAQYPAIGFRWSREFITAALLGSQEEKDGVWRRWVDGMTTFSQLVAHYSLTRPEFAGIGESFDVSASGMVEGLRQMQRLEPLRALLLGPATWDRDIAKGIGTDFLAKHRDTLRGYADKHGFKVELAERKLREDDFRRVPHICAGIMWTRGYLAKHKGLQHARAPKEGDLRDLVHCANAPYVDVLVTERFAGDLTRPLAERFGTKVMGSLKELMAALPD